MNPRSSNPLKLPKLTYTFRDPALLTRALSHASWANEGPGRLHNERMEFLGDAVVQLIVTETLLARFPDWQEGVLSPARARLVRRETHAQLAQVLEIGGALRLGAGATTEQRSAPSILADAYEALIGAIYLDGGLDAARGVICPLLEPLLQTMGPSEKDACSLLQEREQRASRPLPIYEVVDQVGPAHQSTWRVIVHVNGQVFGPAAGSTKAAARQEAARLALSAEQ